MFNISGLTDREILEKLFDLTSQNHALICSLSRSMERELHRQDSVNESINRRLGCLEKDVEQIKKKIAV